MPQLLHSARALLRPLLYLALGTAVARRARDAVHRRREEARRNPSLRALGRRVLPSLYDRHPDATLAARRARGISVVPLDRIVGTTRHPSQNTADFLPLRKLRGMNWQARWQRINRALDRLAALPPVDLIQVGDDYYVSDGHNRVAAALRSGAVGVDADVTELILPGTTPPPFGSLASASTLVGAEEVRQAGSGRLSRTAEYRLPVDELRRAELIEEMDRALGPTEDEREKHAEPPDDQAEQLGRP